MLNDSKLDCAATCAGARIAGVSGSSAETDIGRRTFLVQSAMLAAAAALAACAGTDTTAPTLSGSATVNVSDYSTLTSVGGIAMVTVEGAQLAIVRTGASSFTALSRVCPHQGGIVNQSGTGFLCPNHGAEFTSNGTWQGGQRTSNLHSYNTSFDASTGVLTIS